MKLPFASLLLTFIFGALIDQNDENDLIESGKIKDAYNKVIVISKNSLHSFHDFIILK
jgi:hypothetical protein